MRDPPLAVLRPDTTFQRRYRVIRCLKAGGMGAVYEVLDARTDARRALKIMLPSVVADPGMRARFAQEARITGGVESEHIVRTMDAGVDEETGTPFLVMELLRGEDLGAHLDRRSALPPREVVVYLFQAALALDRTHAAGIVHRDLKPENLFITRRDDGSPCLKILDFGIAKMTVQSGRGRTTKSMGTPLYMAPEQAIGKGAIGLRADVYAFGHIAYTLLAGAPYWEEEWRASEAPLAFLTEVVRGVRESASARAERRGVALPTAFDGWFLKATAVDPEDRFESAGDASAALAEALDVPAPRPSLADVELDAGTADTFSGDTEPDQLARSTASDTVFVPTPRAVGSGTTSAALTSHPRLLRPPRLGPVVAVGVVVGVVAVAVFAARWRLDEGHAAQPATAASPGVSVPGPPSPEALSVVSSANAPQSRAPASVAPAIVSASAPTQVAMGPQSTLGPPNAAPPLAAPGPARPIKARRAAATSTEATPPPPPPPPRESFF